MGTENPSNNIPANPEGEPKPQGFRVKVEQPDLIFQAAQRGVSGELGSLFLDSPISEVSVSLEGGKEDFNLLGKLLINATDWRKYHNTYNEDDTAKIFLPALIAKYPDIKERSGRYYINDQSGTQLLFELGSDAGYENFIIGISTGKTQSYKFSYAGPGLQAFPPPNLTRDNLTKSLGDISKVLSTTVKDVYTLLDMPVPDEELVLRPPKEKVGTAANGSGRDEIGGTITPQELLGKLEIEKPNVKFEDIGGQPAAKKEIESLAFALKNPELYKKWGTKPPKGVIFYGPPGTGKTLMAKALAAQANARFFHVEASDIASKWYGESEKIVKSIFELANQSGESTILFFDEIDAVAPKREGAHEATQKVVGTLLENMDGIGVNSNVMVVASTNRLDDIEPALLRAGRFDRWVEVDLPDEDGRKQIFDIHRRKAEEAAGRELFGDIDVGAVASKMDKANGADIAEIIRRTLEEKVREEGMTGQEPGKVSTEDILKQLESYEKISKEKQKVFGFQGNGK